MTQTQTQQHYDWLAWGLHADWNGFLTIQGTQNEQIYKDYLAKQPTFTEEGHPELTLLYVGIEEDRWEEGKQALCLYLFDKQTGRGDFYILSLTDSYIQDRNNTGIRKTGYDLTVEKLAKIGFKGGDNFVQFATEFFGKEIPCWVTSRVAKQSGKTYFYIAALGAGSQVKAVMPWNIVRPQPAAQPAAYQQPPAQQAAPAYPPAQQPTYQPPAQQMQPPAARAAVPQSNPFGM